MRRLTISGEARYRTVEEARIVDLLLIHGWAYEVRAGRRAEAEPAARAALDRCVDLGLAWRRAPSGGRLFDPVEVSNFLEWAGVNRAERTWEDRCAATARRLVLEAHGGGEGDRPPAPAALGPQRYAVTIRRGFNLEGREPGERVRLRLPLPLEDAALSDLHMRFSPPEGVAVETRAGPARLDALVAVPADGQVTIGVRVEFTARPVLPAGPGAALDPVEADLYTRPREGLIAVGERVGALAAALAGAETDPWSLLRRFWAFMLDDLACGAIHYDRLDPARPADLVLDEGWYDCQIGSALLAALCRARGLPARLVNGYMLHVAAPAFHTWLEVWIEGRGWVPLDLGCWDLSVGGRDADWRDCFFGRLDHRMAVERPPRLFGGPGAVRLPAAWHMLTAPDGRGSMVEFRALDGGGLVYREHIEVERLGGVSRPG
jgi:hypothetical protein